MALVIYRIDEGRQGFPDGTTTKQIVICLKGDSGLLVKRLICSPPNVTEQTKMLKRALKEAARDDFRGAQTSGNADISALVAEAARMRSDLFRA